MINTFGLLRGSALRDVQAAGVVVADTAARLPLPSHDWFRTHNDIDDPLEPQLPSCMLNAYSCACAYISGSKMMCFPSF